MTIQILGTGCPKCKQLEANARKAAEELGLNAEIVKVDDRDAIMNMGVMMTPALAVEGEVKSTGKLLPSSAIQEILKGQG